MVKFMNTSHLYSTDDYRIQVNHASPLSHGQHCCGTQVQYGDDENLYIYIYILLYFCTWVREVRFFGTTVHHVDINKIRRVRDIYERCRG